MRWAIHYADGSVASGEGGDAWRQADPDGVLIVVVDRDKQDVFYGRDYYLWRDETVMAFDGPSLHDHLKAGIPAGAIKFGRWVPDGTWRQVWNSAFPNEPR